MCMPIHDASAQCRKGAGARTLCTIMMRGEVRACAATVYARTSTWHFSQGPAVCHTGWIICTECAPHGHVCMAVYYTLCRCEGWLQGQLARAILLHHYGRVAGGSDSYACDLTHDWCGVQKYNIYRSQGCSAHRCCTDMSVNTRA